MGCGFLHIFPRSQWANRGVVLLLPKWVEGPRKWAPCSIPTNGDLCEKRVRQTKLIRKGFCPATVTPSAVRSLHMRDKSICKFRSTTWCCKVWVDELLWYFVRMSISCCGNHVPLNKEKTDENISWWWIPCLRYCVPSSFYQVWSFLLLDQKATSLADRTILRQITLIKLLGLVNIFFLSYWQAPLIVNCTKKLSTSNLGFISLFSFPSIMHC